MLGYSILRRAPVFVCYQGYHTLLTITVSPSNRAYTLDLSSFASEFSSWLKPSVTLNTIPVYFLLMGVNKFQWPCWPALAVAVHFGPIINELSLNSMPVANLIKIASLKNITKLKLIMFEPPRYKPHPVIIQQTLLSFSNSTCIKIVFISHTINGERFAGLNFCGFKEYHEYL